MKSGRVIWEISKLLVCFYDDCLAAIQTVSIIHIALAWTALVCLAHGCWIHIQISVSNLGKEKESWHVGENHVFQRKLCVSGYLESQLLLWTIVNGLNQNWEDEGLIPFTLCAWQNDVLKSDAVSASIQFWKIILSFTYFPSKQKCLFLDLSLTWLGFRLGNVRLLANIRI